MLRFVCHHGFGGGDMLSSIELQKKLILFFIFQNKFEDKSLNISVIINFGDLKAGLC
jgi:hypothetical protein